MIVAEFILFALLQFLDWHSTMRFLKLGGREGNPLMVEVVKRPVLALLLKAWIIVWVGAVAFTCAYLPSLCMLSFLCLFYIGVVIHNYRGI